MMQEAGLLTCRPVRTSSRKSQWHRVRPEKRLTAAGQFRILTWFPFNHCLRYLCRFHTGAMNQMRVQRSAKKTELQTKTAKNIFNRTRNFFSSSHFSVEREGMEWIWRVKSVMQKRKTELSVVFYNQTLLKSLIIDADYLISVDDYMINVVDWL